MVKKKAVAVEKQIKRVLKNKKLSVQQKRKKALAIINRFMKTSPLTHALRKKK